MEIQKITAMVTSNVTILIGRGLILIITSGIAGGDPL